MAAPDRDDDNIPEPRVTAAAHGQRRRDPGVSFHATSTLRRSSQSTPSGTTKKRPAGLLHQILRTGERKGVEEPGSARP